MYASGDGRLLDIDAYLRTKPRVVRWQFLCSLAGRRRIGFQEELPFLGQIRGHDDERLAEYARAVMAAEAWPD